MSASLVGSEMCIRDRPSRRRKQATHQGSSCRGTPKSAPSAAQSTSSPVSYTHLTLPTICSV
eukprot:6105004-Alexandrium_andersonii.AAC.1